MLHICSKSKYNRPSSSSSLMFLLWLHESPFACSLVDAPCTAHVHKRVVRRLHHAPPPPFLPPSLITFFEGWAVNQTFSFHTDSHDFFPSAPEWRRTKRVEPRATDDERKQTRLSWMALQLVLASYMFKRADMQLVYKKITIIITTAGIAQLH